MSRSNYWKRFSRYIIPGAMGFFMAYGIGSGYLNTTSNGSELDPVVYESSSMTVPGVYDPYRPKLKDIFFNPNSSRLRDDAKLVLDENAQVLRSDPDVFVVIESYCDSREESPAHLGSKRGEAVREYMSDRGVDTDRVLIVNKCNKYDLELVNGVDTARLDSRVHFVPLDQSQDRNNVASAR